MNCDIRNEYNLNNDYKYIFKQYVNLASDQYVYIVNTCIMINVYVYCIMYIRQKKRKRCLTAPLSVTGGHILNLIGKFFGILYYWVHT